jgi:hypothetical protein
MVSGLAEGLVGVDEAASVAVDGGVPTAVVRENSQPLKVED